MTQTGSNNVLTIIQDGTGGQIGVESRTDAYFTGGSTPQFTITFQGVDQTSSGSGSNTATLTQHGTGSVIGDLQQNAASTAAGNKATATQTGANVINHIWQTQDAGTANTNVVTAIQSGSGNVIDRVDQRATGNGTSPNTINVDISGSNNGKIVLSNPSFYGTRAGLAGATQSALIQNKYGSLNGVSDQNTVSGNAINLTITGSDNQYGMTQKGSDNTTGMVTISGSNNSFGSYQAGQGNVIGAGEIAGSNNDVGVWQIGTSNSATVSVLAFGNDYNQLSIAQGGTSNIATANIAGSFNGTGNFSGPAAGLVGNSGGALSNGSIVQGGQNWTNFSGNIATLDIFGSNNKFAIASLGSNNEVTGKIGTSSLGGASNGNSAAVLQNGNNNVAAFSQTGAGTNSVAISQ
ncbi:beta strand repeat-containing protein [Pseudaminobacter soli (ex Zhang et al. 2022)]|nr:hypothetical protein [Pseudaminobacter soli]